MQFHSVKRVHKNKAARQVGRGGSRGKTSGRGTKGQKARSGRKMRPEIRDIIKRLPKLRGRGKNSFKTIQAPFVPVSLEIIEKSFSNNDIVSPKTLVEKGLAKKISGQQPKIKLLSGGDFSKKVTVIGCEVSETAQAAITKAGGVIK